MWVLCSVKTRERTNTQARKHASTDTANGLTFSPFLVTLRTPLRKNTMAPRGPRSDLCVVVVMMSAWSKGEGSTLPATSPEM